MAIRTVTKALYATSSTYLRVGQSGNYGEQVTTYHGNYDGGTYYAFAWFNQDEINALPHNAKADLYLGAQGESGFYKWNVTDTFAVTEPNITIENLSGASMPTAELVSDKHIGMNRHTYIWIQDLPKPIRSLYYWGSDWNDVSQPTYGAKSTYLQPKLECTYDYDDSVNVTVIGRDASQNIYVSVADAVSLTVNAYQNNTLIATRSVSGSSVTFEACTFTSLSEITFKVTGKTDTYTFDGTDTINPKAPTPNISNLAVSGTSIDVPIIVTADKENVTNWTIQAIQNDIVKATKTGTGNITATFNIGEFNVGGTTIFKVTYSNLWKSGEAEIEVNLSYTQATINLLELPSSSINVDQPFTITWVTANQTNFSLQVGDKIYTGTTQKSITVPKGVIVKGTKSVTLTITFKNSYYSNTATTTATFVGYGAPSAPVLNTKSVYSSANPTLSWTSDEQVTYEVTIKRQLTVVESSKEVISTNKYYLVSAALENGGTYTVSVKIKNKYGLWSTESTAEFTVQFTVPKTPTIQAIADITTGSIILNVNTDTTGDTEYKNTEIWKREPNGVWKRMAYKLQAIDVWQDFYVAGGRNYEYKARNVGQSGGISESDVIIASTTVSGFNFYDVQDSNNFLRFMTGENPKPKINQSIVSNLFANASAPTSFGDGVLYYTCSFSFKTDDLNDLLKLEKIMKAKLLLYKDNKGHKWFGNITNSPDLPEDDVNDFTLALEFIQSQFTEEDVYCGDNIELISWNGGWKFDGTHILGGE